MALFVLAPETPNADLPFRADIKCDYEPCTPGYSLGSVLPVSVPNSGPATLTLRGSGFAATDTVTLTRSGSTSIPATVRKVGNGITMTTTADLTDVTPGGRGTWWHDPPAAPASPSPAG